MFINTRETFEERNSTNRLKNYRLPFSKSRNKLKKEFQNMSSEINTPAANLPYKSNISMRVLKNHRKSATLVNKSITMGSETPRDHQKLINTIAICNYFHISLLLNGEEVQFKSYASSVASLLQELKKTFFRQKSQQGFVLESIDDNIPLSYYLSLQGSKMSPFWGKNIKLKPYFTTPQGTVDLKSFDIIKCIGSGGFSKVFLGRFKGDGLFYAMKVISKSFIIKHKKQKLVQNERNVMVETFHPLHAKLNWCFQSKNYLILVMDYYPGGELFNQLKSKRRLTEKCARFYVIEILLALEKLHDSGIAYRDIKPENILLDRDGHAHLADFGLAKPGLNADGSRAFSFCGSPEYMPPEIISRKGHTLSADFYSIGALLYELITGLPPFYCRDPEKIYEATLKKKVPLFPHFSQELKSLLEGLLCKEHEKRLGSRYGVKQVLSHPWFGRVEVQQYLSKKIETPVNFRNLEDLKFDNEESNQKIQDLLRVMEKQQANLASFSPMFQQFGFNTENRSVPKQSLSKEKKKKLPFSKNKRCSEENTLSLRIKTSKVNNFL